MHLHRGVYHFFSNRILVHLGVLASWREFALSSRTLHLRNPAPLALSMEHNGHRGVSCRCWFGAMVLIAHCALHWQPAHTKNRVRIKTGHATTIEATRRCTADPRRSTGKTLAQAAMLNTNMAVVRTLPRGGQSDDKNRETQWLPLQQERKGITTLRSSRLRQRV